jgi:hypothetical protein
MRSACRIAVGEGAFLNERKRFEPFVGVRSKRQASVVRGVGLWPVVVEKEKRIEAVQRRGRKSTLGEQTTHRLVVCGDDAEEGRSGHDGWGKEVCKMK